MSQRSLRCYVAGVQHESSSFSPVPTGARSFFRPRFGVDGRGATMGLGYGESCEVALDLGFELIAGPFASAQPSLPTAHAVWSDLRDGILDELRALGDGSVEPVTFVAHPRDGILGYFDQYGFSPYGGTEGEPLLEAGTSALVNPLLNTKNFTMDFDALELLNGKRYEMIRTPTAEEIAAYAADEVEGTHSVS